MNFLKINSLQGFGALVVLAFTLGFLAPTQSFAAEQGVPVSIEQAVVNADDVTAPNNETEVATNHSSEDVNDPLEPINRVFFEFNEFIQDAFLHPVSKFYNEYVNVTVRQAISNILDNLSTPVIFANDVLQGEVDRAITTFGRAMINTTFGILGMADVATEMGIERHDEDFGQTLAVYGVDEGFYLVLPVFGPSSPRDVIGKFFVDSHFDVVGNLLDDNDETLGGYVLTGARGIDEYSGIVDELDQVKKTSVDYYAAVRSLYRQKRKAEIHNGSELELPPIPDLGYDVTPEDFDQPLADVNQPSAQ
ncbi:MAG: VacJ family lipoprotein [Alphaproteobacteria bacterium]|jgi:phospholipid-binding lipoprotein MlaA|nr:VacJ family lipoprotein [Alphaproteobacteria bacterium]MBT7942475.1 VacJ family lipoprotein [Alphaproteobacteria bacterium]